MKFSVYWLLVLLAFSGVNGCATVYLPDVATIGALPTVELGQVPPANNEYILLLRAGVDVPVAISITGSLLSKESKIDTTVQLKQDVYIYKNWSSLDGKNWGEKNVILLIAAGLDASGGKVNITVDERIK
jgi:hypothetical protein